MRIRSGWGRERPRRPTPRARRTWCWSASRLGLHQVDPPCAAPKAAGELLCELFWQKPLIGELMQDKTTYRFATEHPAPAGKMKNRLPSSRHLFLSSCFLIACKCLVALIGFVATVLIGVRFGRRSRRTPFSWPGRFPCRWSSASWAPLIYPSYRSTPALAEGDEAGARRLAGDLLYLVGGIALIASAIYVLLAPSIVAVLAPGLSEHTQQMTVRLTRIMAFSMVGAGLYGVLDSILNADHRYYLSALGSLWLPLGTFLGVLVLSYPWSIEGVAMGTLSGAVLQGVTLLPGVRGRLDWRPRAVGFGDPRLQEVLKPLGVGAVLLGIWYVNESVGRFFASFCGGGAVSSLAFGYTLVAVVPLLVAFPLYKVLYPAIVRFTQADDKGSLARLFSWNYFIVAFATFPVTALLAVLSVPITAMVFRYGRFSDAAVAETARVVLWMSFSLWSSTAAIPLVFYLFVARRFALILKIALLLVLLHAVLAYLFMRGMGVAGIALSSSLVTVVRLGVMVHLVRRLIGTTGFGEMALPTVKLAVAAVLAAAGTYAAAHWAAAALGGDSTASRVLVLGGLAFASLMLYLMLSLLLCGKRLFAALQIFSGRSRPQEAA